MFSERHSIIDEVGDGGRGGWGGGCGSNQFTGFMISFISLNFKFY